MLKKVLYLLSFLVTNVCMAQVNIIPQPESVTIPSNGGTFAITPATIIVANGVTKNSADFLNDYLKEVYGFTLKTTDKKTATNAINLTVITPIRATVEGAYDMDINSNGVNVRGQNAAGTFYGIQSLIQLLPVEKSTSLAIPYVSIHDKPRFQYRGLMLDCGRHFFPVSFVKKYIDFITLHKMNYFHWHLTEDQGWRIEIKRYPLLTDKGAFRNGTIIGHHPGVGNDHNISGGFYTQDQVKEIVAYAAKRYITVVPEIEMPGHASAAIAAYPELSCFPDEPTVKYFPKKGTWAGDSTGKQVQQAWGVYDDIYVPSENTFKFLENVLDEVIPLFPGKYIHIGGDEAPKENWKRSAFCQQLMKEKGLKDEHELQSYFVQRIEKYINSKGKTMIGWDEILEGGLAPNATVMSWRGEKGGIAAAQQKHNVIMTPTTYVYFDYSQSKPEDSLTIGGYLPLKTVYNYEPIPTELQNSDSSYILGAQANVWTEYMTNQQKVEYMIFPRLSALSEVLWSSKASKNWDDFAKRLPTQFKRYNLWNADCSKQFFEDMKSTGINK
ncbi:beta-N-acetylhexosaminidase [Ilyomonas limi]|uniref:beta-N-acetylhexosaminidase n=1 Tax=Ilyomonas limi TaxID=2575867 RepID=A0A4U3L6V7_9BACT|nr:beta-N-acetylhexosaminidase [Ilyomonas limi]TKK70985.1 beta-N-acetylhexosaminidase [Ilyomonas limi]